MKKLLCAIALGLAFVGGPRLGFAEIIYSGDLVNDAVVAQDSNYDLDTRSLESLSFTVNYSTVPPAVSTFSDGRKSTATITVSNWDMLLPRKATATISVMAGTTTTLRGLGITINGTKFYSNPAGAWTPGASATTAAAALAAVIDAHADFEAVSVSTVVYATAAYVGQGANLWTLATNSTTYFRLNGSNPAATTFVNGSDQAKLVINGVTFTIPTSTAVTSNAVTAKNISDSIVSNTSLNTVITSSYSANIVYATATTTGLNAYAIFTSTAGALRVNGSATVQAATFLNGAANAIDLTNNTIDVTHRANTGFAVWLGTGGFTTPGGLANGTTYYIIKTSPSQLKLSTTKANATAGTAIDITSNGSGGTFSLNPVIMPATQNFGLKWQAGNDGTNFVDLSVSSITINSATAAGTAGWDFGAVNYRYYRLKYTAPAQGGTTIRATGSGRN